MLSNLSLCHEIKPIAISANENFLPNHFRWETCLRRITIGFNTKNSQGLRASYQGLEAYEFLLEVLCGLHSPIIGETEVWGQFRMSIVNFLEGSIHNNRWTQEFRKLYQCLNRDIKMIRENYLLGLGQKSYGSLARKYCKLQKSIFLLGSGHLAQEIYPWLYSNSVACSVWSRKEKIIQLKDQKKILVQPISNFLHSWRNEGDRRALLVAAPISDKELATSIMDSLRETDLVLDFRENTAVDFLQKCAPGLNLKMILEELSDCSQNSKAMLEQAKLAIKKVATGRVGRQVELRPFGWEDICA